MTEKELKKLNRYQLLEMIILQTEQVNELTAELEKTRAQLESQQIRAAQAGSIAEAALQLSGIFEAAQSAADIYLENVIAHTQNASQIEVNARTTAEACMAEAQQKAQKLLQDAQLQASTILQDAQTQADSILSNARTMLDETTLKCKEKETMVNNYNRRIRETFNTQCQNLDSIAQNRVD